MSVIPKVFDIETLHRLSQALTGEEKLSVSLMEYPTRLEGLSVSFTKIGRCNEIAFEARMNPDTRGYELIYRIGPHLRIHETIDSHELELDFELIDHLGKFLREWRAKPDLQLIQKYKPRRNQFMKRRPRLFFSCESIENTTLWMGGPDRHCYSVGDEVYGMGTVVGIDKTFYRIQKKAGNCVQAMKYGVHRRALAIGSQVVYNHPEKYWPIKGDTVSEVIESEEEGKDYVSIRTGGEVRKVLMTAVLGILQWGDSRTSKKISSIVV